MERIKSIEKVNLPDGKYYGDWCSYYVTIKLPDWKYKPVKVNSGLRGTGIDKIVEVIDGWLYIN